MLCPVMGKTMVVATGELSKVFTGMIKMNDSSTVIWKWVEEGKDVEEIYKLYASEYDIDIELAKSDVDFVVGQMLEAGVFE